MVQRELIFYPETERTRDLIYSEYTSCDRSIHVLLQEDSIPHYPFLLEAYREIVAHYLSFRRLQSPAEFIRDLMERLEKLAVRTGMGIDDIREMGFYLVLQGADASYVLTSREGQVYIHNNGDIELIGDSYFDGVARVRFEEGDLQAELFPQGFKDCFALFRIDRAAFGDRELILGCGEEEKSTVLEALSDPLQMTTSRGKRVVSSKFITRKLLVVSVVPQEALIGEVVDSARTSRAGLRRPAMALAGIAAVALVGAVVWRVVGGPEAPVVSNFPMEVGDPVATLNEAPEASVTKTGVEKTIKAAPLRVELSAAWQKSFSKGVTSSPALSKQAVIFGCRDGNLYALDRKSGAAVWKFGTGEGVGASPVVKEGTTIAANYSGTVFALNTQTGELKWKQTLPMRVVSSPSLMGDRVLVGCYDGFAYCLSITDGQIVWKRRTQGRIRSSVAASGDRFFVASFDGFVYALDAASGEVAWRHELKGTLTGSPAFADDVVVIGAPDGRVYALDAATGEVRWNYATGAPVKSSATIAAGRVYVGSNDGYVYCLNVADGSLVWKFKTGGLVLSRPHIRDDVVYIGSYDGFMYCLAADTGKMLSRFNGGAEIYSSPIADGAAVYFGTNKGQFMCLKYASDDAS